MLFASIFIPDFSFQALFAKRPELQSRSIALIDGTPPLLRVVAANDQAKKAGVEVGLLKAQAEAVGAEPISRSSELEGSVHAMALMCVRQFSPRVQDKAIDQILLDIDGLNYLFGSPEQIATKIRSSLAQEHLSVNVGVAGNPDTASIAAHGFPNITIVTQAKQIGSLPVTLLEPGERALETLNLWGITTLSKLAALDAKALTQRLGQPGLILQKLARGQQVNPFVPDEEHVEFRERTELEYSVDLLDSLSFVLSSLLERICGKLEEHALATNEIDYEFALDPPRVAGEDLPADRLIYRRTLKLSNPTTERKRLLRHIQLDLQSHTPTAPIMAVSLRAHAIRCRHTQLGLFAPQAPDPDKLELILATLSNLAGQDQVGAFELLDTHRPRAFVMAKFEPEKARDQIPPSAGWSPKIALRLFEPARRATIRLCSDIPWQLSFDGKRGEVVEHSSPWLSSGEWWNEMAYSRKEWDVEVQFTDGTRGKFLIFVDLRTNQSFVDGSYD
jgi:protein ImuB